MTRIPAPYRWLRLAMLSAVLLVACTDTPPSQAPATTASSATAAATSAPPETSASPRPPAASPQAEREAEVLAAYRRSWEVFATAFRTLDTAPLEMAFANAALQATRNQIAEAQVIGQPVHVDVTHRPRVILLEGDRAVVQDTYANRSAPIDPATGQPVRVQAEVVTQHRALARIGGSWKVTDIIEIEQDPSP